MFEDYGIVVECDVMNRCGFVHMKNAAMAESAIVALNATDFKGQSIVVEHGRPKERVISGGPNQAGGPGGRPQRGGRGGGGGGLGRGAIGKWMWLNSVCLFLLYLITLMRLRGKPTLTTS